MSRIQKIQTEYFEEYRSLRLEELSIYHIDETSLAICASSLGWMDVSDEKDCFAVVSTSRSPVDAACRWKMAIFATFMERENLLEQIIISRISAEVDEWNPLTDHIPIHTWLYSWLVGWTYDWKAGSIIGLLDLGWMVGPMVRWLDPWLDG
uniref:GCFC domain-containing protein n=1 Tax=Onchocerca volvulus TaxID=6282 RepID=A0A8R1TVI5_ONCVO